jgi:hypothetical protein
MALVFCGTGIRLGAEAHPNVIKAKLTINSKSHGKIPGLILNLLDFISAPIHIRLRILRVVADNELLFQLKLHAA